MLGCNFQSHLLSSPANKKITDLTHTGTHDTSTQFTRSRQCGTTRNPSMAKVRGKKNQFLRKHFLLIFSFLLNHRTSQSTYSFGKWELSKPLLFSPFQQCAKFHLLVCHLKMFLKDTFVFLKKKEKNLYFEVKKEALLPLNSSLKQEDVVVSIIPISFRISQFFFWCSHQNSPT